MALTAESFRLLSLAERGLLMTMRYYAWCNDSVPTDPAQLARALGLQEGDVREHFTPAVREFFEPADDDPTRLVCVALVRQMDRLMQRREAQAKSGRDSAMKRRLKRNPPLGNRDGDRTPPRHGLEYSTAQNRTTQLGKEADKAQPSKSKGNGGDPDPEFVRGLESVP